MDVWPQDGLLLGFNAPTPSVLRWLAVVIPYRVAPGMAGIPW